MADKISIIGINHESKVTVRETVALFALASSKCRGMMLKELVGSFTIKTVEDIDNFAIMLNEIRPCFER